MTLITCGKTGLRRRELAPPWFHSTRSQARAASSMGPLPYGPKRTSGSVAKAVCIAARISFPVSRTSSATLVHGGGRAVLFAQIASAVAPARPYRLNGPLSGVTRAARRCAIWPHGWSCGSASHSRLARAAHRNRVQCGRCDRVPRYSAAVGCPFAPVGIITASFGEALCVNAFSGCGLDPGSRRPQRAPGRAWRSVRFWNRLAACCEAR